MAIFRKIAKSILGIDDTELSDQAIFIQDLYKSQKNVFKELNKKHIDAFLDTFTKKHDLIEFGLLLNRQILLSTPEFGKKEVFQYYDLFENIKGNVKEKILLLKDNPWIGIFERDSFVFVTKRDVKLSEIEINAITHDVLNSKELFIEEQNLEAIATKKKAI